MEKKGELARRIGNQIRETRKNAGLTLKQLAKATELSPALLSRVENGQAMPSIATLQTIANSLKVDIGYLFKNDEEKEFVISRQGNRRILVSNRGPNRKVSYEVELLAEEGIANPFMEPAIVTLMGNDCDKEIEIASHDGQEFMYVIEGKMKLTLGEKKFILNKGDAAYWNGSVPHKGISLSKRPARTLNVHLIPGRRVGTFKTDE